MRLRPRLTSRSPAVAASLLLMLMPACGKREPAAGASPSPPPSAAASAAAPAGAWHYVADADGTAHVDMPGLAEHIQGEARGARGAIDLVAGDLASSRGQIAFDLATFATHTFHSDKDAAQTAHARTWLEVKVGDGVDEAMRWVTFSIRSIDSASVPSLAAAPRTKDGDDVVRTVAFVMHGDLQLHGRTLPEDALVDVVFRSAQGDAEGAPPRRIDVRSRQPMRVVLKDFDVRPRDPAGQLVAWTTQLVSKVAETADVTVEFHATLAAGSGDRL
jgi:hypothetical protein